MKSIKSNFDDVLFIHSLRKKMLLEKIEQQIGLSAPTNPGDDLDKAVSYVHELIQSEHGRTMRNTQLIDRIQNELAVFAKGEVK